MRSIRRGSSIGGKGTGQERLLRLFAGLKTTRPDDRAAGTDGVVGACGDGIQPLQSRIDSVTEAKLSVAGLSLAGRVAND